MAATTPNLGLTLPVGNEKVSRQIINGNNSIIDTAFGSAGAKLLDIELNEVTNVSGAYTGTTYDDRVTSAMKALEIEMGNPGAFRANITVNCGAGYITLSCSDVVGTSTVKVSVLKLVQDPTQVTSTEFDILNNRIGTLADLDTTAKTSTVAAINEVKGDIPPVINNLTSDSTTSALSAAQGKALNNNLTALDNDTIHLNDSAAAGGAFSDGTNSWGISLRRKADDARYILRGREGGRIGLEKSTDGSTWSLLYETVKTSEFGDAKARIYRLAGNLSTFVFEDLPDLTSERYKLFLLVLGDATNANDLSVFIGGVGVNGASVSLKKIIGGNYTLTGSIANNKLTITSNVTCYGGMRLIWLA